MKNYRLIILTTGLAHGGAESQLTQLAIRLKLRGWAVERISMLTPKEFVKELTGYGIEVKSCK